MQISAKTSLFLILNLYAKRDVFPNKLVIDQRQTMITPDKGNIVDAGQMIAGQMIALLYHEIMRSSKKAIPASLPERRRRSSI